MEIEGSDNIDSFSSIWAIEQNSQVKIPGDPVVTAATKVVFLHQMQRALEPAIDPERVELIDILIRYGHNSDGIPALHYAIKMQDERAVELLLKRGANPNSLSRQFNYLDGYPERAEPMLPLDFAAFSGNEKIIHLLLQAGANVNFAKLGEASHSGMKVEFFRTYSPLYFAAKNDQENAVRILIENGASLTPPPSPLKPFPPNDPLYAAVNNNSVRAFRILLEYISDLTPSTSGPLYLLHYAASRDSAEIVQLFLQRNVPVDVRNQTQETALIRATGKSFKILLAAGADPKAKATNGWDAFYTVCAGLDIEAARLLLERGVDINAPRGDKTPFQIACFKWLNSENKEAVKEFLNFLLENGADINASVNGRTALTIAKNFNQHELVQWLVARGAKE